MEKPKEDTNDMWFSMIA